MRRVTTSHAPIGTFVVAHSWSAELSSAPVSVHYIMPDTALADCVMCTWGCVWCHCRYRGAFVQTNFVCYTTILRVVLHYVNTNLSRVMQLSIPEQYQLLHRLELTLLMYTPHWDTPHQKDENNLPKFIASRESCASRCHSAW